MMNPKSAQIIYLNGPSSSGKTIIAKALQNAFEFPYLHVGIDKIIGWMPEKVNDWTGGGSRIGYSWKKSVDEFGYPIQELHIGPYAKKMGKTFQEVALTLAKSGHRLIIDDVSFGKEEIEEWRKILKGFQVLWVGVNAPLSILEQREKERGDRIIGSARGHYLKVHADVSYDLELDTFHDSLESNVEKIKSFIPRKEAEKIILKTKRLILRLPTEADSEKVKAFDDRNKEHLSLWRPENSKIDYKSQLIQWNQEFKEGKSVRFLIFLDHHSEDDIIGFCNFSQIFRGPFQACYLGYHIDKNSEGKGFMHEAITQAIEYMFEEKKIHRIMANYMPSNVRSARLLQKLGFVVEGQAKKYLLINGVWEDHILTSLTNENWFP